MLDEAKQKILNDNLLELEQMFYTALKRFAENSSNIIEFKPNIYAPMSLMFRIHVERVIESREKWNIEKTEGDKSNG